MENKLLQVGDTLYEYGNYGIYNKVKVDRVTPKTAFLSDGYKTTRKGWEGNGNYFSKLGTPASVSGLSHYRIEDKDMISEWFRKTTLETLKNYRFDKMTNEQLSEILKIINP